MYQFSFEDDLPADDDIDELFSQLEQFKPPADFVNRVMDAVSQLPLPQYIRPNHDEYHGLIVHQEQKQFS
jgi:hypothetical protein